MTRKCRVNHAIASILARRHGLFWELLSRHTNKEPEERKDGIIVFFCLTKFQVNMSICVEILVDALITLLLKPLRLRFQHYIEFHIRNISLSYKELQYPA